MKSFLVALFRPVFASRAIILTVIAGLLYRAACGMQGVDTVDVGFCNTFYQVIFTAPDSNVFNFLYYLTGLTACGTGCVCCHGFISCCSCSG